MTYKLTPGTAAYRIVSWLEAQGRTKEFNSSQIGYALHLDTKGLPAQLESALQAGLVFRRQKDSSSPRAPFWYSLTDHGATHRREFRPAPKDWMQPLKDAAGPPASDGAASEGTAVTPGPSQPEAAPDTSEGLASQQVLKAEAARPDATAREATSTGSPGVGPMGAGQPADAGPTTDMLGRPMRFDSSGAYGVIALDARDPDESAAQQGNLNPVTDAVEPAAPAALPLQEERREVDAQFAASLRAAMGQGDQLQPADLAATRRAVHAPHEPAPLAFRAARFTDGSLATERDGIVVAVYSAAEVDAIQKLLGVRG